MNADRETDVLHCFPCGPRRYFGGGGRTRERLTGMLRPVRGRTTVISLHHACLASGLFPEVTRDMPVNWTMLNEHANRKWSGSADRFLAEINQRGITRGSVDQRAAEFSGARIGWAVVDGHRGSETGFGICPDLELSLAILSRRVVDIFVSAREPDFSWDTLFSSRFEFDDQVGQTPQLDQSPWANYRIEER